MTTDQGFWAPLSPAYVEPTEEQLEQLRDEVMKLAWNHAGDISRRIRQLPKAERPPGNGGASSEAMRLTQDYMLSVLRMLREVGPAADALAARAASDAGAMGATYVQLGEAWGITRQSARSRWPGVTRVTGPAPEPTELEMAGGTARISYLVAEGGWWWVGSAANGNAAEAETTYDVREEAIVHAGAFLLANQQEKGGKQ